MCNLNTGFRITFSHDLIKLYTDGLDICILDADKLALITESV